MEHYRSQVSRLWLGLLVSLGFVDDIMKKKSLGPRYILLRMRWKKAAPKPKANPRRKQATKPRARKVAKKASDDRDLAEDVDGVVDDD